MHGAGIRPGIAGYSIVRQPASDARCRSEASSPAPVRPRHCVGGSRWNASRLHHPLPSRTFHAPHLVRHLTQLLCANNCALSLAVREFARFAERIPRFAYFRDFKLVCHGESVSVHPLVMPSANRVPSTSWFFIIGVLAGWTIFTLIVIGITWASYAMQGRKTAAGSLFIQYLGLFLWGVVTFLVMYLARRWPLGRKNLLSRVCLHLGLGLALVIGHVGLEYALGHVFGAQTTYLGLFSYKAYIYFLIYWLIVGATTAYDNHARCRESQLLASQLEAQLAQSQLHALKMQLHPHFLFNTHHAIIALMLKGEVAAATKMLTRLSDLLRLTLDKSDQQVISLRDELSALDLYLGIQKERYRERLRIEITAAPDSLTAEVPSLLLQPLVENAFKHGIDTLSAGGVLRIGAWRQDDTLCLSVADNGPGCIVDAADEKKGVGLGNTRARLHGHYGENQRLEIRSEPKIGTEIRIVLPFKVFRPAQPEFDPAPA